MMPFLGRNGITAALGAALMLGLAGPVCAQNKDRTEDESLEQSDERAGEEETKDLENLTVTAQRVRQALQV